MPLVDRNANEAPHLPPLPDPRQPSPAPPPAQPIDPPADAPPVQLPPEPVKH